MIIVLDATPLGLLCSPNESPLVKACNAWLQKMMIQADVIIPETTDYEVRRELIRVGKQKSIRRLDRMTQQLNYLALSTEMMRTAAELWAEARQEGKPTASDDKIDFDVILAAQALSLQSEVVVATGNVKHLTQYVNAKEWSDL
jgi:predicted nucleic acid-binding protein